MILILAFLICNQKTIIREGFREGVSGVCQAYNKAFHSAATAASGSDESTGRPTSVPPNTTWDEVEKVCKKQGKAGDSSPRAGCIKFKPWKKTRAERRKYGTPCCWKEDTGKWYYNTTTSTPKHFCKRAATKTATKSTKKGKCRVFSKASYAAAAKEAKSGGTTLPTFDKSDQMCGAYGEVDCTNPGPRLWSEYDNSLDKDMRYPCCWHYDGTRGGKVKRSNKGDKTKCQGQTATKKAATKTSKQPVAKKVAKKVVKDATVGLCKAKDKTASWAPDSATIAGCQKAKTQKDCIAEDAAASKAKRAKSTSKGGAISYETMCQWTGTSSTSTPKKGVAAEKSVITSAPVKSGDTLGAGSKGLDVDYVKGS